MIVLFNIVSEDGYIAGTEGEEDFIPDELWSSTMALCKKYGAIVMGRKTYEALQEYKPALLDSFEALPVQKIVVSRNASFTPRPGYLAAHSPSDAFERVAGLNVLVCSGPGFNTEVVREGLIDTVLLQVVPVRIHEGIMPFDIGTEAMLGKPTKEEAGPLGTKLLTYQLTMPAL